MKTRLLIANAAASLGLVSCAGWSFSIRGPYGEAHSEDGGPVTITPLPVVIPSAK